MRKQVEKIFTVAMLFFTTAALSTLVPGSNDPYARAEGGLIFIGIQIGLYSVALFFIATRWQPFLRGALKIKWIAALLAIAGGLRSMVSGSRPNPTAEFGAHRHHGIRHLFRDAL